MKFIDIGVNLFDKQFHQKEDDIVSRAKSKGVQIIITGTSIRSSKESSDYVKKHPDVYTTAGVHPHSAKTCNSTTIDTLHRLINENKNIVAVGECGLDYDRMFSPAEVQKEWFEKQICLAEETGLPLFLHERKAQNDFLKIMKRHKSVCNRSVVHCFTDSKESAMRFLNLGCYIGITGWICDDRRNKDLLEAIKIIPLERMMIETDAPYLTPRISGLSRTNVPENITYVLEKIAQIRGVEQSKLQEQLLQNTKKFFNI